MFELPLKDGDTVICGFPFRDRIVIITEFGKVFQIKVDQDYVADTIRLVMG